MYICICVKENYVCLQFDLFCSCFSFDCLYVYDFGLYIFCVMCMSYVYIYIYVYIYDPVYLREDFSGPKWTKTILYR